MNPQRNTIIIIIGGLIVLLVLVCVLVYFFVRPLLNQDSNQAGEIAATLGAQSPPPIDPEDSTPECTVLERLNLRLGPGTVYDPPITVLVPETLLKPLARDDGGEWLRVELVETGQVGWVNVPFLDCNIDVTGLPLGQVPPTPTLVPTATATPMPTTTPTPEKVACTFTVQQEFETFWQDYEERLGCPNMQSAIGGLFVEQRFEQGKMFWIGELDWFFVNIGHGSGQWVNFKDEAEFDARFNPNHDGATCEPDQKPSSGQVHPIRGFGAIWCGEYNGIDFQDTLGFGTEIEHGQLNNQFLAFEKGFMLRASDDFTYIYFKEADDTGSFVRE
ncbi:MAG: hypothetical protein AAF629_36265 [Chloroflexota bacterium]